MADDPFPQLVILGPTLATLFEAQLRGCYSLLVLLRHALAEMNTMIRGPADTSL
jgi:hypothetical protein